MNLCWESVFDQTFCWALESILLQSLRIWMYTMISGCDIPPELSRHLTAWLGSAYVSDGTNHSDASWMQRGCRSSNWAQEGTICLLKIWPISDPCWLIIFLVTWSHPHCVVELIWSALWQEQLCSVCSARIVVNPVMMVKMSQILS